DPPPGMLCNSRTTFGRLSDYDRVFQNLYGRHDWRLSGAYKRGDWYRTADLLELGPDWIHEQINQSGLRGRSGMGLYAGNKWAELKRVKADNKLIVVNCAEGEPGTCKDREILRYEPHKLIEGCVLAGFAMGCEMAIVFVRARYYHEASNLLYALTEAYRYGLLGENVCDSGHRFDILLQRGDDYLTGEETALMNCLMGKLGRPRRRPPQLTEQGYFGHPCAVLNVESVAVVPTILRRGPLWWAGLGRPGNSGTKLFNISGHVMTPCTVEEEMSMPLRELIELHAGGVCGGWQNLLALFPGGLSCPLLSRRQAERTLMDFDSVAEMGSEFGTGGIIVISKQCDPLLIMLRAVEFYSAQSCRQCTPCRDGARWLPEIFRNFASGKSHPDMIDFLHVLEQKTRDPSCICELSQCMANQARSLLEQFKPLIQQRIVTCAKS
ncbi:hypothetical protein KR222_007593, partial [Zaprionus bogoriensis]